MRGHLVVPRQLNPASAVARPLISSHLPPRRPANLEPTPPEQHMRGPRVLYIYVRQNLHDAITSLSPASLNPEPFVISLPQDAQSAPPLHTDLLNSGLVLTS
ncbi:hypothetical protein VTJ04DRAFT_2839 [Mycothermus thermophilus]|uniref:uncharacterized protein n=1 Tax=Humicola insolens TaxID=85995 RepID=UPI003742198F